VARESRGKVWYGVTEHRARKKRPFEGKFISTKAVASKYKPN